MADHNNDTMSLKLNQAGARLPYWLLAVVAGVLLLAGESRWRLATQGDDIREVKASVSGLSVMEHRLGTLERESEAIKEREQRVAQKIGRIERSLAVICDKLGANCPKE